VRWHESIEWFRKSAHDSGKTDRETEAGEFKTRFEAFEASLGAVVNEFYATVEELDGILEDANRTTD